MVQHVCRHITQRPTDHLRDSHFQAGEVWRLSSSQIKQTSALLPSVCQHFCMNVLKRSVRSLEWCTAAEPDPPPGRRQIVWRRWRPSLCSAWSFGADAPPPSPPAWETSAGSQRWLSHICHYCGEADTNSQRRKVAKCNQECERRFTWKCLWELQRNIVPEQVRMCRDLQSERGRSKRAKNQWDSTVRGCFHLTMSSVLMQNQLR